MVDTVEQVIAILEDFSEDLIRRLATQITFELQRTTPVDTGWARANWIPQIGVPFEGNATVTDPQPGDVASAAGQQAAGQAAILGYRIELGSVFISNNVPYIINLNNGSSRQAPPMFVERAIDIGTDDVLRNLDPTFVGR